MTPKPSIFSTGECAVTPQMVDVLNQAVKKSGLSLTVIAHRSQVSVNTLRALLKGNKRTIRIGVLQRLSAIDKTSDKTDKEKILPFNWEDLVKLSIPDSPFVITNIPRAKTGKFVGREKELSQLRDLTISNKRAVVTQLSGQGGIGKTRLAVEFALSMSSKDSPFRGGICFLEARYERERFASDLALQITDFFERKLGNAIPDEVSSLEPNKKIEWCFDHWKPEGDVLLIYDDVTNYESIQKYLPPLTSRFKVVITTRLRNFEGEDFGRIELNPLSLEESLELLVSLARNTQPHQLRIQDEVEFNNAVAICNWLGHLPLALKLVGSYMDRKPHKTFEDILSELEKKRLEAASVATAEEYTEQTRNLNAAIKLSWDELSYEDKELAYTLSLFALAPIPWFVVEKCFHTRNLELLEDIRDDDLINLNLLSYTGNETYKLHEVIKEYFYARLEETDNFIGTIEYVANSLSKTLALFQNYPKDFPMEEIVKTPASNHPLSERLVNTPRIVAEMPKDCLQLFAPVIPHAEYLSWNFHPYIDEEDLKVIFSSVSSFWIGQWMLEKAGKYLEFGIDLISNRAGENSHILASLFSTSACLYYAKSDSMKALEYANRMSSLSNLPSTKIVELITIGDIFSERQDYDKANEYYFAALNLYLSHREAIVNSGDSSDSFLITLYQKIGQAFTGIGDSEGAKHNLLLAWELAKTNYGDSHTLTASIQVDYGKAIYILDVPDNPSEADLDTIKNAEKLVREGKDIVKLHLGKHPYVARYLTFLSSCQTTLYIEDVTNESFWVEKTEQTILEGIDIYCADIVSTLNSLYLCREFLVLMFNFSILYLRSDRFDEYEIIYAKVIDLFPENFEELSELARMSMISLYENFLNFLSMFERPKPSCSFSTRARKFIEYAHNSGLLGQ